MSNEMKVSYALSSQIEMFLFVSFLRRVSRLEDVPIRLYGFLVKVHGREMSFCIYSGKVDGIRRLERKKIRLLARRVSRPCFYSAEFGNDCSRGQVFASASQRMRSKIDGSRQ